MVMVKVKRPDEIDGHEVEGKRERKGKNGKKSMK